MINEHKKRLNDIKNMQNFSENEKSFIKNKIDNNKEDINASIKMAKDFLNNNKLYSSKIYSNIESFSNTTKNTNFNHPNNINFNSINDIFNNNYKNQINYHPNYNVIPSDINDINNSHTNINKNDNGTISKYFKNNNYNTIETNNKSLNNIKEKDNYNIEANKKCYKESNNNVLLESSIKILKIQLENKDNKIKALESNINFLNNENKNLKEYINKLESSIQSIKLIGNNININNNNDLFSENSQNVFNNENNNNLSNETDTKNNQIQALINKENISTINDNAISNIEKIMNTINYFIRKMYISFNNEIEQKEDFNDLNYNQHYELQNHLIKIENMINNMILQNKNIEKFKIRNKNKINIDKNNEFEKEEIINETNSVMGYDIDKIKVKKVFKKMNNKKENNITRNFDVQNKYIKRSKSHNKINVFKMLEKIKNIRVKFLKKYK